MNQATHAGHYGIEEEQQLQGHILVVMQHPIAGPVSRRGVIMQTIQHRAQLLKILEALKLLVRDPLTSWHTHVGYYGSPRGLARIETQSQLGEGGRHAN